MANINVTIRMDENLKREAETLFEDFGLTLSTAFTMFVKQAVREQRIPFQVRRITTPVEFASDEEVDRISNELLEKYKDVYKRLANTEVDHKGKKD